jgi:two-component system response regulator NreC
LNQAQAPKAHLGSPLIRCVLVDDHALLRQGVRRILQDEPDFEVVGEACDGSEALKTVIQQRPSLVLMDIGMPGPSSFDTVQLIQEASPQTKVVFLTMHEDADYVRSGLQAGATGYLLKDTPADKLVKALREIHRGNKCVSPELLGSMIQHSSGSNEEPFRTNSENLTPREREVMRLLAEGNTVRRVAEMLRVSIKTIEAHKFNLMRKLDIHNKAQLVTYAIRRKILKLGMPM